MDKDKKYLEFASTLSFFEFIQEEFYNPHFDISEYEKEIEALEDIKALNKNDLKELIVNSPRVFDIFEQIFQLYRFTNTQFINFLFNIEILNSIDRKKIIDYLVENVESDKHFKDVFNKYLKKKDLAYDTVEELRKKDDALLVKLFKEAIVSYVNSVSKKRAWVYYRLIHNENSRERLADYLINNLKLGEFLESINLKSFLKNKRIPKDTKSIHGKFGTIKINNNLVNLGVVNADEEFKKIKLRELDEDLSEYEELNEFKGKWIFVTEKYVNNILKKKQGKRKKFDFIIIHDLKVKYVVETNFYSTQGTKIGINEEEYIDLNEEVKKKLPNVGFVWISDGNYWLTSDGESRYKRDLDYFGDNILNYNLFKLKIGEAMK